MQIVVESLSKSYGGRKVVDDLSFVRLESGITGLLGANGSGKSTTMRMMLGLTARDSGSVTFDGLPFRSFASPGRSIGVMLDAQANHRGRSGIEILRVAAATLGVSPTRADELLELVGLGSAGSKRFGGYSLGMKQRLGIAQALLGDPTMLILDEPVNGMDPEGILWMRNFLRSFADEGGSVLLSSHLLREVEAIADSVIMIADGAKIADAKMSDLLVRETTTVAALDLERLCRTLDELGIRYAVVNGGSQVEVVASSVVMGRLALEHGIVLTELRQTTGSTLEDFFFRLSNSDVSV